MAVTIVNVHEAKTHLSRLLVRVANGEEIVIARAGHAVAKLIPIEGAERRPGRLKGRVRISRDFDAPLPEAVLRELEGKAP
jgi:prevent-host-death family protein